MVNLEKTNGGARLYVLASVGIRAITDGLRHAGMNLFGERCTVVQVDEPHGDAGGAAAGNVRPLALDPYIKDAIRRDVQVLADRNDFAAALAMLQHRGNDEWPQVLVHLLEHASARANMDLGTAGTWAARIRNNSDQVTDEPTRTTGSAAGRHIPVRARLTQDEGRTTMPATRIRDDVDLAAPLHEGEVHYVSVAMPGLTVASSLIETVGGFDTPQRNEFMMRVNRARETGTLYPRVNITLLPSPRASYLGVDDHEYHQGDYPVDTVIAHILDAFRANHEHVRSTRMYFDFRSLCVSPTHYTNCLDLAMTRLGSGLGAPLPEVFTWHPSVRF